MLKILKMAWRSWLGYRLKAVSLFIFTSISFTVVLLGVDVLYNSFNISFDSATATFMPRFFVCGEKEYDFDREYGIGDLSVPTGTREKLEESLGNEFKIEEGAFFWSALTEPESSEQAGWSFVTGLDLASIGEIFPALAGKLSAEEVASLKGGPFAIANQRLKTNLEVQEGKEFVLLSYNYYGDFNAIRVKVAKFLEAGPKLQEDMTPPILYMDVSQLGKLFGLPAGRSLPLILTPRRPAPAFSMTNGLLSAKVKRTAEPLGLGWKSSANISGNTRSSFTLYLNILRVLIGILVVVMAFSISSSLFISFQSRLPDFGLFKAFGLDRGRLFLLVLLENAIGMAFPCILALFLNFLADRLVPPFNFLGLFDLDMRLSAIGIIVLFAVAVGVCFVSILQSFRFLDRLEPVSILGEE